MKPNTDSKKMEPLCGSCLKQTSDGFCKKFNKPAKDVRYCIEQMEVSDLAHLQYIEKRAKERDKACMT